MKISPFSRLIFTKSQSFFRLFAKVTPPAMDQTRTISVPCRVGDSVAKIDTPVLVVDMAKLERNLAKLPKILEMFPNVCARVHSKAHKCPDLAKLQLRHGANGICCQILSEAEAMVNNGLKDVLVSNQVIGHNKVKRLLSLSKQPSTSIAVCVDNIENIRQISEIAQQVDTSIDLVIEVNVGQNRCGVEPGPAVVKLAKEIIQLPRVQFKGIQCYQGLNQHVRTVDGRKSNVDDVVSKVKICLEALSLAGIPCNYVTGGGTGSFIYEAASGVFSEVQPGSYVVMDADYARNLADDGTPISDFEQSLYIISTVQSVSTEGDRAVVDCGLKGVSLDSGPPVLADYPEITFTNGGDEHGILSTAADFKVGDRLRLVPGHCDPTINMYDWIVAVRDDTVEHVWPVAGRGPGV